MYEVTLLRREALTKMVNTLRTDDEQPLPITAAGVLKPRTIDQTEFSWDLKAPKRDIGEFQAEGSPAGVREYEVIGERSAKLAYTFQSGNINGSTLLNLRNPGDEQLQKIAEDEVGRMVRENARHLNRQDEFMIASALQGSISMTLKAGAQRRTVTVDYGFAADHQLTVGDNQLGTDVLATGWDDQAAPVLDDLDAIQQKGMEDSGYVLRHAWTSKEMITKLMKNDFIRDMFKSTVQGQEFVRSGGEAPVEIHGILWHPVNHVYKPVGGSATRYIPKNRVVFTPDPDPEWGEFVEGASVQGAGPNGELQRLRGRFAFAKTCWNPAGAELFYGSPRLPIIYVPGAVMMVDPF